MVVSIILANVYHRNMKAVLATFFLAFASFTLLVTSSAAISRQKVCESTDAEEGPNFFKSGATFIYIGAQVIEEKKDTCESDDMLIEYYCNPEYQTIYEQRVICRQGCIDAKCYRPENEDIPDEMLYDLVNSPVIDEPDEEEEDDEEDKNPGILKRRWRWIRLPFEKLQGFVGSLF